MRADLKGIAFHKGARELALHAGKLIEVRLVRDPANPHDQNAIRVTVQRRVLDEKTIAAFEAEGGKFDGDDTAMLGHVDRKTASTLAPRMDECGATHEAMLLTTTFRLDFADPVPPAAA